MFQPNLQYEAIFAPRNIDEDCYKIADEINDVVRMQIKEILAVCIYKQAVSFYLHLLKSMANHFVDDEHNCYFDDIYSPEYCLQWIYEDIMNQKIDQDSRKLLEEGHKEILQSKCYKIMAIHHTSDKYCYEPTGRPYCYYAEILSSESNNSCNSCDSCSTYIRH